MKKWKKVCNLFFVYKYKGKKFLIQTYPFKIYKIHQNLEKEEIIKFTKSIQKKKIFIQPTKYYLPLLIGTTKCNFKCKYCYAYNGTYGENALFMDNKIIDATINFLIKKMENNRGTKLKEIEIGTVFLVANPSCILMDLDI